MMNPPSKRERTFSMASMNGGISADASCSERRRTRTAPYLRRSGGEASVQWIPLCSDNSCGAPRCGRRGPPTAGSRRGWVGAALPWPESDGEVAERLGSAAAGGGAVGILQRWR
jgi:hypothetical protein